MSATISEDSIMIKEFGIEKESVQLPLVLDIEEWSGEKMIITPAKISDELTRTEMVKYFGRHKFCNVFFAWLLCWVFKKNNQKQ